VKLAFYLIGALMVAAALAALLLPLLRQGRRHGRSRGVFLLALAVALLLPLGAAGMYLFVGTPVALDGIPRQPSLAEQKQQAVQQWMTAAHAYDTQRRTSDARDAYQHALELAPDNTTAMVGWVEAEMAQQTDFAVDARARQLLQRAIALEPNNQRALWLWGIAQFQQQDYAGAAATWKHLLPLLDSSSALAQSVQQQIALADAKSKMPNQK
jgi:cytochrome c-type biogenesis protein CcmH